jgi:hypothetical protein
LMAEELMLPKVSCRNLVEILLRLMGSSYLACHKDSTRARVFSACRQGFEGSRLLVSLLLTWVCCLRRVAWQNLQILVSLIDALCQCRSSVLSYYSIGLTIIAHVSPNHEALFWYSRAWAEGVSGVGVAVMVSSIDLP